MGTLFDSGITVKASELKLALHIACHSSILTVHHLGEGYLTTLTHPTESSALIKHVLPEIQQELLKDIREELYSLIIDESINVGMHKLLAVSCCSFANNRQQNY